MAFELRCDTCEFVRAVDREVDAYTGARDHEYAHPSHFVFITAVEEGLSPDGA